MVSLQNFSQCRASRMRAYHTEIPDDDLLVHQRLQILVEELVFVSPNTVQQVAAPVARMIAADAAIIAFFISV